jgi:hypothetical protein
MRWLGGFDGCPGFEQGWVRISTGSPDVTCSGLHDLGEMLHIATRPGDPVDRGGVRECEEIGFQGWFGFWGLAKPGFARAKGAILLVFAATADISRENSFFFERVRKAGFERRPPAVDWRLDRTRRGHETDADEFKQRGSRKVRDRASGVIPARRHASGLSVDRCGMALRAVLRG